MDRFASHTNHLCPRFNSAFYCPGTEAVDAFSQDWGGENNWVNPPFGLEDEARRLAGLFKTLR